MNRGTGTALALRTTEKSLRNLYSSGKEEIDNNEHSK